MATLYLINFPKFSESKEILKIGRSEVCVQGGVLRVGLLNQDFLYIYCYRIGLLVLERVKLKKCVSVLQNDGVKKLVGPMHILMRPTHFFLLHTIHKMVLTNESMV